jgi:hypothetical protein
MSKGDHHITDNKQVHGKESSHLINHIKTRTHIKNQYGIFEIKKVR